MNNLIQITTNEQGSSVVSARDLYTFLGFDNSQWSRWSKKNIVNNPFGKEGEDWQELDMMSKTSEGGRPTQDYALTIDFAKRLSMLARTEQGEEIRRYFVELEKQPQQPTPVPAGLPTEQVLVQLMAQSNQLLVNQQRILDQLRTDVDKIMAGQHSPKQLKSTPLIGPPSNKKPTGLRGLIHQKVNDYCAYHSVFQSETYNYLYKRLYDVYGVNVYRLIRAKGESLIDALERYGHLDRLYSLVSAELNYTE